MKQRLPVWPDREPVTLFKLVEERRQSRLDSIGEYPIAAFTCDECAHATRCDLAFDWYNTHGDCLADK